MAKDQPTLSKEDKEWKADRDAEILAEANIILGDSNRLKAAKKAANKLAKEAKKAFEGMLKVANKGDTVEGMKVLRRTDH